MAHSDQNPKNGAHAQSHIELDENRDEDRETETFRLKNDMPKCRNRSCFAAKKQQRQDKRNC